MAHERRPMSSTQGMDARGQQAARDALRRRQKEKQSRTVKRHVRYKEKQRLFKEMEAKKPAEPIVSLHLGRPGDEDDELMKHSGQKKKKGKKKRGKTKERASENKKVGEEIDDTKDLEEELGGEGRVNEDKGDNDQDGVHIGDADGTKELERAMAVINNEGTSQGVEEGKKAVKEKKKYLPFTKEMKVAEKARKEWEDREKDRLHKIEIREKMLKKSKKKRKSKGKQFRSVTRKGQPKLKHRLDAMLAQIQNK